MQYYGVKHAWPAGVPRLISRLCNPVHLLIRVVPIDSEKPSSSFIDSYRAKGTYCSINVDLGLKQQHPKIVHTRVNRNRVGLYTTLCSARSIAKSGTQRSIKLIQSSGPSLLKQTVGMRRTIRYSRRML